jgi:O-methyltransferase
MSTLINSLQNWIQILLSKKKFALTRTMVYLGRNRQFNIYAEGGYVRLSSLELVSYEINDNGVKGAVAELGVYRGRFAKKINEAFPTRKLYLFDTFEGFDQRDIKKEISNGYSTASVDLTNTSIDLVLDQMPFKNNCIIKKGFFPDTAVNLDETFAFVSIDTDLYQPIYDGLKYFYPRLTKGGYIFVHDYNNHEFKGSKQAVRDFCNENGVSYFPLSDYAGSAVISKG